MVLLLFKVFAFNVDTLLHTLKPILKPFFPLGVWYLRNRCSEYVFYVWEQKEIIR